MGEPTTSAQPADPHAVDSRAAWARAAIDILTTTAGKYHLTVTYSELAQGVQEQTGVHTNQLLQHWIGEVLGRVADTCANDQVPNLSSLCVNSQGSVGTGYADAVERTTGVRPLDADEHAALIRLECYRHHGAHGLPAGGGEPALTSQLAANRTRQRKRALADKPIHICRTCFVAMPATGLCDTCD